MQQPLEEFKKNDVLSKEMLNHNGLLLKTSIFCSMFIVTYMTETVFTPWLTKYKIIFIKKTSIFM